MKSCFSYVFNWHYIHAAGKSVAENEPIAFHLMGWLNKIFRGSSHKISEGQYDWRCEGHTEEDDPSTAEVSVSLN